MQSHTRVFTTKVEVRDPIGLHTDQSYSNMHNHVAGHYAGKCYEGCLIREIVSIKGMTPAEICYAEGIGNGIVEVQFDARIIQYMPGDIIVGALVRNKTGAMIYCTVQQDGVQCGVISIDAVPANESVRVGQNLILRVLQISYPFLESKFSAIAAVYAPPKWTAVYECGTEYEVTTDAEELADQLEALIGRLTAMPGLDRYRSAVSSWRTPQRPPAGSRAIGLLGIARGTEPFPKWLARDTRIPLGSGQIYAYDAPTFPGDYGTPVIAQPETMVCSLLREEIADAQMMLAIGTVYAGAEYEKHANLWAIIAAAKN